VAGVCAGSRQSGHGPAPQRTWPWLRFQSRDCPLRPACCPATSPFASHAPTRRKVSRVVRLWLVGEGYYYFETLNPDSMND
jgi:hypothetical protein